MRSPRRWRGRTLTLGLTLIVAVSAAGCGSDDSGESNRDRQASEASAGQAGRSGGAAEIQRMLDSFNRQVLAGDGDQACSHLTSDAEALVSKMGRAANCEEAVSRIKAANEAGNVRQQPAEVLDVEVAGDEAVVEVSDAGRPAVRLTVVRRDGDWKIPAESLRTRLGQPNPETLER